MRILRLVLPGLLVSIGFAISLLAAPAPAATTPGPPVSLTCPYCGEVKYIASIASGNNIGGEWWSDTRSILPMLPRPSAIQHCPHCDGYFFYQDAVKTYVRSADDSILDEVRQNGFGNLSFVQMDKAYSFLGSKELTERQNAIRLREWFLAFNDVYSARNPSGRQCVPDESAARFAETVAAMLENKEIPAILKADLYRETGRFDECLAIARMIVEEDEDNALVARQIIKHAEANDTEVFMIELSDEDD